MTRIVSLVPSATEIVAALGLSHFLAGRTHECDYPADVARVPAVTRARIDVTLTSGEIDAAVREMAGAGLPLFELDERAIAAMRPTMIITQGLCPVCAIDERDVCRVAGAIEPSPMIVRVQPMSLGDVMSDIATIAAALGYVGAGESLAASLKRRMEAVRPEGTRPRVLLLEWLSPFFSAGHWNPELIALAGGEPVLAEAGTLSRAVTMREMVEADPDVIVLAACGFSAARARAEAGALDENAAWRSLRAVREGRVHIVDGSHYFNRPGPRLVDSLEMLAGIVERARASVHAVVRT